MENDFVFLIHIFFIHLFEYEKWFIYRSIVK